MATNPHTNSVAIVLPVPAGIASKLAVDGGEPAGELHLTIACLAEDVDAQVAVDAIRVVAATQAPIVATLGKGVVFANELDAECIAVDSPALDALRAAVIEALAAVEVTPDDTHPFTPHVTIAYVESGTGVAPDVSSGEIVLDRVDVWAGSERTSFRFSGVVVETLHRNCGNPRACLKATLSLDGIPTELRLFAHGENETAKGTITLDAEGGANAVAEFTEHGTELPIDFDHGTYVDDGNAHDVAGYHRGLEMRADGLWATGIDWTAKGLAAISPGVDKAGKPTLPEYRYYSPSVFFYPSTRRLSTIGPTAIVTWPATMNQTPMVLGATDEAPMDPIVPATDDEEKKSADVAAKRLAVLALAASDARATKLDASMSFDDIRCALYDELQERWPDAWACEVYDDHVVFSYAGKLFSIDYRLDASDVILTGDAVEVQRSYAPIQGGSSMSTITETLGMKSSVNEAEILSAIVTLKSERAELLRALDATNPIVALAAVESLKADREKLSAVEAENAALKATIEGQERDVLVKQGEAEGRFSPATIKLMAKKSPAEVRELLSLMPVQPALLNAAKGKSHKEPGAGVVSNGTRMQDANGKTFEQLSADQKSALKRADLETYNLMRADWQGQDRRQQTARTSAR